MTYEYFLFQIKWYNNIVVNLNRYEMLLLFLFKFIMLAYDYDYFKKNI